MLRFERPRPCEPGCFADAWVGSLGHPTAVFGFGLGPSTNTKPVHTIDGWMDVRSVTLGHENENNNFGRIIESLNQTNSII